ncbi:MAG: hypothetical protein ACREIQ_01495 [Nitrospiria bacterium]
MIRLIIILVVLGVLLLGVAGAFRWLGKNRVRVTIHRAPTGREILFISMALQALKTLIRLLLRR